MHEDKSESPPRHSSYREALYGLNGAQKSGAGVPAYTRWVNRRLARYAAAGGYVWRWTPNMVTASSAAFSVVAIILVIAVPAEQWTGFVIGPFLAIGYLLDSADGQLARLQRSGGPAGEWLDHVVDAMRTPAVHLAVLVGFWREHQPAWALVIVLCYCLVSVVQFMSQILAEQLATRRAATDSGVLRSFILLPTDNGTFCWIFVLWGFPPAFLVVYTMMFALNTFHSAISMRRKYRGLQETR